MASFYLTVLVTLAIFAASFGLGAFLSARWRMPDYFGKITLILFTFFAGTAICVLGWNNIKLGIDLRGGVILVYQLQQGEQNAFSDPNQSTNAKRNQSNAADQPVSEQLVTAISKRINPGGVKEVTVRPLGSRQVEIIIPEVETAEVDRIRRILGSVGTLEFRILATRNNATHSRLIDRAKLLKDNETALYDDQGERLAFWVPVAERRVDEFSNNPTLGTRWVTKRNQKLLEVVVVQDPENVTGGYLTQATAGVDEKAQPAVHFMFNSTGAQLFGSLTGRHIPPPTENYHYQLGVILDGRLETAPNLNSAIFGNGQITGYSDPNQVKEIVDVLNAGALPAALSPEPVSQQFIGPTLGQDTIEKGLLSLAVSMVLVFAFVLVYYRFAGIVAAMALIMNAILLLAIMISIKAAFTLPGLAGFALTIGMAVDANVLIYERMREEAQRGAALRMVIRNGFDRALSAIVDSNLTTLITAVVLYVIGTDQVRGFAVTLFLGIVLSMFTAIFCARVVFDVAERRRWISHIGMMRAIGETNFSFLRYKWVMAGISGALILIGIFGVMHRGRGLLGIDFTGGVSVQVIFREPHDIADVRRKLENAQPKLEDVVVSDVRREGAAEGTHFKIDTSSPPGTDAEAYLHTVEAAIQNLFDKELVRNQVTIQSVTTSDAAKPAASEPSPKGPDAKAQGRLELPPGSQALAISSMMLGQATPAKEAATPAPPANKEPVKEAAKQPPAPVKEPPAPTKESAKTPAPAPAKETPSAPPKSAADASKPAVATKPAEAEVVTSAQLRFTYGVDYQTLETAIQQSVTKMLGAGKTAEFDLDNPNYEPGSVTPYDTWNVRIHLPQTQAEKVFAETKKSFEEEPVFPSANTVGGAVAQITRYRAVYALLASALFILLYLWVRFQRISYGLGAIASLIHDVLIALGFVAVSYYLAKIPLFGSALMIEPFKMDLTIVTALLTVAGYSLNDTIVIFDRIREVRGKAPVVTEDMINLSINQTLGRTLLTGLTSIMVIVILYILGGETIHGFAYAMLIGVLTGTYSSIYIASPFLLWLAGARPAANGR